MRAFCLAVIPLALSACSTSGGSGEPVAGGGPVSVERSQLTGWKYVDGLQGMPPDVRQLSGKRVELSGSLYPVSGREFLLVESPAVLETCESEINQIVQVTLPESGPSFVPGSAVRVVGRITVGATYLDGYCVDVYQLEAESVAPR